jgi:hypothetical protein
MYRMRSWSVRNARWLKRAYEGFETLLVRFSPLLRRIGYERLDRPFAAVEKMTKGVLLDSQNCGQCIVGFTGLSCPMNCPKKLRNGPCGGVRADGSCEVRPEMKCVWVLAWEGNKRFRENGYPIQTVQPAVDNRLVGKSAWLRAVRLRAGVDGSAMHEV